MYICVCKAVTDQQIVSKIENGICTFREITHCLGVGKGCGKCSNEVKKILNQYVSENYNYQLPVLI